jgi:hypothetical protein
MTEEIVDLGLGISSKASLAKHPGVQDPEHKEGMMPYFTFSWILPRLFLVPTKL